MLGTHPKFALLETLSQLGWLQLREVRCSLGLYGADSVKPVKLWYTHAWAQATDCSKDCSIYGFLIRFLVGGGCSAGTSCWCSCWCSRWIRQGYFSFLKISLDISRFGLEEHDKGLENFMPSGINKGAVWSGAAHNVRRWVSESGRQCVTGLPGLTSTQRYPWGFADKLLKLWEESVDFVGWPRGFEHIPNVQELDWVDAHLGGVSSFLRTSKDAARAVRARLKP
jgi:hypothetical protein